MAMSGCKTPAAQYCSVPERLLRGQGQSTRAAGGSKHWRVLDINKESYCFTLTSMGYTDRMTYSSQ